MEEGDYRSYISNGFAAIDRECRAFDNKIEEMSGSFLPRHEYSVDDLLHSQHLAKIQSLAGKMKDDITNWKERGAISGELLELYEYNINIISRRVNHMISRIRKRRTTVWEKISEFLICTYYFLVNMAAYHIKSVILPNVKDMDKLSKPFHIFNRTAENFGDFLEAMSRDFSVQMDEEANGKNII
jgi:hypothetical protein